MKIRVVMKDPDTLHEAISDAVRDEVRELPGVKDEERPMLIEAREECARAVAAEWFKWSEYLGVEIDTEAETITVLTADQIS